MFFRDCELQMYRQATRSTALCVAYSHAIYNSVAVQLTPVHRIMHLQMRGDQYSG